jgi:MtN3 and saliva related transmembrane protein
MWSPIIIVEDAVELFFAMGLFINACLFIPQIMRMWRHKNSEDVSLLTFLGFNIINLFAVLHSIIKVDWILISGYTVSFITNTLVTLLILRYRYFK